MRNASVMVQVALMVIALTVLWFYVNPAFSNVSEKQDLVSEYDSAIEEADTVNRLLNELTSEVDSLSEADQAALDVYLPDSIDTIEVQRDLLAYVQRHELVLESLAQSEDVDATATQNRIPQEFTIAILGTYEEIKNLLADVERNNYPLHLTNLNLMQTESSLLRAEMTYRTYYFIGNQ